MTKSFYRKAHGIIVVFDVTDEVTFKSVTNWMQSISDNTNQAIAIILIGNKVDLKDQRKVMRDEAQELARKHNVDYFETSALDGSGINEAFSFIIEKSIDEIIE